MTPRILVVAGSDSGGGAGIQADVKTVMALGGHATTAITAITVQNTLGVTDTMPIPAATVVAQMAAVLDDIGVDAVKIGMLGSGAVAHAVAEVLEARCRDLPIIVDPVLVATSGDALGDASVVDGYRRLFDVAALVTPNVTELARFAQGYPLDTDHDRLEAAEMVAATNGVAVLSKGGDTAGDDVADILCRPQGAPRSWTAPRIDSRHTHGTGCTLASAIAVGLGRGEPLEDAITVAHRFVRDAILAAPGFGGGHGPMGHGLAPSLALNQVTLPLPGYGDYDAAVAFYTRLGLRQIVHAPWRYARFEAPNGTTLSVEAGGIVGDAVIYLECADLDERVAALAAAGVAFDQLPRDESWGWREARLSDPAGNRLCLYRAGTNRRFPPWRLPE